VWMGVDGCGWVWMGVDGCGWVWRGVEVMGCSPTKQYSLIYYFIIKLK